MSSRLPLRFTPPALDLRIVSRLSAVPLLLLGALVACGTEEPAYTSPPPPPPAAAAAAVGDRDPDQTPTESPPPMGVNAGYWAYYSGGMQACDIIKNASGNWGPGWPDTEVFAEFDDQGWPANLKSNGSLRILLPFHGPFRNQPPDPVPQIPVGEYQVTYEGRGINADQWNSELKVCNASFVGGVRVDGNAGDRSGTNRLGSEECAPEHVLIIQNTDPADYVRNVQVLAPGCDGTQLLRPGFRDELAALGGSGVVRWMAALTTNTEWISSWEDKLQEEDLSWHVEIEAWKPMIDPATGLPYCSYEDQGETKACASRNWQGIPYSAAAKATKEVGGIGWFNIPAHADDDFVLKAAQQVAGVLGPDAETWVEWSNEVWNSQFEAFHWAHYQGGKQDPPIGGWQYYAKRSREVCRIWKSVMPNARCVFAGQAAWDGPAKTGLEWLTANGGTEDFDFYAVAPYLSEYDETGAPKPTTLDELVAHMSPGGAGWITWEKNVIDAGKLADQYGMKLIAYEGGDHVTPNSMGALSDQLHADPRMYTIMRSYFDRFFELGGVHFNFFHDMGVKPWGALPATGLDIDDYAQARALRDEVAERNGGG